MNRSGLGACLTLAAAVLVASAGSVFAAENGVSETSRSFGVMDLAILFCLGVVAFWAFSRVRWYKKRGPDDTTKKRAADAWQYLSNDPTAASDQTSPQASAGTNKQPPAQGFDRTDFMDGARLLYSRLQTAWAARRLEELRPFVEEALFARFEEEARRDPAPKDVTVVLVEGSFAGSRTDGETEYAEVLFKALLREGGSAPAEVRERWRFMRGPRTDGMWRLESVDGAEAA